MFGDRKKRDKVAMPDTLENCRLFAMGTQLVELEIPGTFLGRLQVRANIDLNTGEVKFHLDEEELERYRASFEE